MNRHTPTNRKTVLAVDDDPRILRGLEKRLSYEGYKVLTACTAHDAQWKTKNHPIDAYILDVQLAGKADGLTLGAALENDPQTRDIPKIFITGVADRQFERKCRVAGGDYFFAKPYDGKLLLDVLRRLLDAGEPPSSNPVANPSPRYPFFHAALGKGLVAAV